MKPRAWVSSITFSDGTTIQLSKSDVVVIVGPNNSGKSASLRAVRAKFENTIVHSFVIKDMVIETEGSLDDVTTWLVSTVKCTDNRDGNFTYQALGAGVHSSQMPACWKDSHAGIGSLAAFFCHLLTADERLTAANPAPNIAITTEIRQHPIHFLIQDDALEGRLSEQFRKAFGQDLVLHRNAGNNVPIHVGIRPIPKPDHDRISLDYILELEKLPPIQTQGDGMRSFAGVLLHTMVGEKTVLMIDEPEAFLHPPQARCLGHTILTHKQSDRQIFIATHSGDVLRGILNSNSKAVRVVRLRRDGSVNVARELDNDQIAQFWGDSLLRYSNILDGLFHEKVVVCESDSDCRFYGAVTDAIFDPMIEGQQRAPDIMFTHCGGKGRLPVVIKSLRKIEVPMAIVADFDVLSNERPLRDIVEATGADWSLFAKDWAEVKSAIDGKKPELSSAEIDKEITSILKQVAVPSFPSDAKKKIQEVLRRSSPWAAAKQGGVTYIPNGAPSQAFERLNLALKKIGVFVVPSGELEGFSRTTAGHGPAWVNDVLKKDLRASPEFETARTFVHGFVATA